MNANDRHLVDAILKHRTLSRADFRRVEQLGDDGFDYIKEILCRASTAQQKINGLGLLGRVGTRMSERQGAPRLAEVFDVATGFLADPDPGTRAKATRTVVGTLGLLRALETPLEVVGGSKRVWDILQRALKADPKQVERKLVEKAMMEVEPLLGSPSR